MVRAGQYFYNDAFHDFPASLTNILLFSLPPPKTSPKEIDPFAMRIISAIFQASAIIVEFGKGIRYSCQRPFGGNSVLTWPQLYLKSIVMEASQPVTKKPLAPILTHSIASR
jgi:hypothetical protein